ncbi:MAG: pyridoxamine 5'-phosphate oxidase family protein [Candidatus Dormibacteraeota bacterium]|nr:pyridoxamine 5'-phosphate oxidase family protein [Candidatus Dormibacteraeota bacterium]
MAPGYLDPAIEPDLLSWSWAEERLLRARTYWVATTRADGLPHCRPVWAVFLAGRIWFSTAGRIAENIRHRPDVSLNLDNGDECVIVEGVAEAVTDPAAMRDFAAVYGPKYGWDVGNDVEGLYAVRPRVAFGWRVTADAGSLTRTATRWLFAETSSPTLPAEGRETDGGGPR